MVLYRITLVPLAEELRDADTNLLSLFYAEDGAFDGLARWSALQLQLLMDQGLDWGYFNDSVKLLFISDNPEEKEAARREFKRTVFNLNCVGGSRYLGAFFGPREELEAWVQPKVEA